MPDPFEFQKDPFEETLSEPKRAAVPDVGLADNFRRFAGGTQPDASTTATRAPEPKPDFTLPPTINIAAVVPDTGEPFGEWFDRRYNFVSSRMGTLGPGFAAEVASQPISDDELQAFIDAAAFAQFRLLATPPRRLSPAEQEEFEAARVAEEEAQARVESDKRNAAIIARAQDPEVEAASRAMALRIMGGRTDDAKVKKVTGYETFEELVIAQRIHFGEAVAVGRAEIPSVYGEGLGALGLGILAGVSETLEALYKPISAGVAGLITGPAGRQAQLKKEVHQAGTRALTNLALPGEPTGQPPSLGEVVEKLPSQETIWKNAVELGPGRSYVVAAGGDPASVFGKILSGGIDAAARWYADPLNVVGEFAAGARLARRIPGGTAPGQIPGNINRQLGFRLYAQTPDDLIRSPQARKGLEAMWADIQQLRATAPTTIHGEASPNLNAFMDRWGLKSAAAADDLLRNASSLDDLSGRVTDQLYGRITAGTRTILEARKKTLEREIAERAQADLADPTLPWLQRQVTDIEDTLRSGAASSAMREIPRDGLTARVKANLKRPDRQTPYGRMASFLTDPNWTRKTDSILRRRARGRLPANRAISLADKSSARADFEALARLIGLSRELSDDLTTRFLRATSDAEARDIYAEMLSFGRDMLPPGLGLELTQYMDNPIASVFWVDRKGKAVADWVKRVVRGEDVIDYNQPVFWSQITRTLPLPNVRDIVMARSWSGRAKLAMKGIGRGGVARTVEASPNLRRMTSLAAETWAVSSRLVSLMTGAFWVPAVLFRVGWPLRVTTEESVRLLSVGISPLEENFLAIIGRAGFSEIPEEALARYGRLALDYKPSRLGIVSKGSRGYHEGLADNLLFLRNDPVIRHLASHTDEETTEWLLRGKGRKYLSDYDAVLGGVNDGTATVADWVHIQREALEAIVGRSERLREAIRTGKLRVGAEDAAGASISLESSAVRRELRLLSIDELPTAVHPTGEFWRFTDQTLYNRAVSYMLDVLGAKPTNVLNRAPAFRGFYRRELTRLKSIGMADDLAAGQARNHAIQMVGEVLYDTSRRTAFDVAIKNIAPFFPAWKEVLNTWAHTIPAQMGFGLGHAVLARRLQVAFDALVSEGGIVRDSEGKLELRIPGLDRALSWALGIDDLKSGVPLQNLNIIATWPGLGPVPSLAASRMAAESEKFQDLLSPFFPYGFDASLGPRALGRVLRGYGIPVPWDMFVEDYQQTLFDLSVTDVIRSRTDEVARIAAMPANTDAERQAKEQAVRDFYEESEEKAASVMLRRGWLGLILPAQPRLYWPNQEEASAFFSSLDSLSPDERGTATREFKDRHPEMILSFIPKTTLIPGEEERERSLQQYFDDIRSGAREALGDKFLDIAIGTINYETIRRKEREALADLGTNAADWLRNGVDYNRIKDDARKARELLEHENPTWSSWWNERIRAARRRDGQPLPTLEEDFISDALNALNVVEGNFIDPHGDDVDTGALRNALRILREKFDLERFYSERELPPGPERDLATYYDKHYIPFWEQIAKIRERTIDKPGATDAEQDRGHLEIQRLRNSFKAPTINGNAYPHPDEVIYARLTDEEKHQRRTRWVTGRVEWLSKFQREQLGLANVEGATTFWDAVQDANISRLEFLRSNRIHPSSTRARAIKEAVEGWEADLARFYGVTQEYELSSEPVYRRVTTWNAPQGREQRQEWTRITQVADAAWANLAAAEVGPQSTYGLSVVGSFTDWLRAYRQNDATVDLMLTDLQDSTFLGARPGRTRRSFDTQFVPFFFF